MSVNLKRRVVDIVEAGYISGDWASYLFDRLLVTIITLNVVVVILETVPTLASHYGTYFLAFDFASAFIFTIEYIARVWSVTVVREYRQPFWGRLRFALQPLLLIDLLAILPFYIPLFFVFDPTALRVLRLLRIVRVLKIYRYSEAMQTFVHVFQIRKKQLWGTVMLLIILILLTSSLMYAIEHIAQPEKFSSLPAAMWWSVITLTTVGYGDVTPITPLGKTLAAVTAMLGVGLFAVPAGILASGFTHTLFKRNNNHRNGR